MPLDASGKVPPPFIDATGPDGKPDGLPDLDELGQFLTISSAKAPTPFFTIESIEEGARAPRDAFGRALRSETSSETLYGYIDTSRTFAASLLRDLRPLLETDPKAGNETVMKLLTGLPVLLGRRDPEPTAERTYPPDPSLVDAWLAAKKEPPPLNLGTEPVTLKYRAFDARTSPLVDLVYALGQIVARPEIDDTLALFRRIVAERPDLVARLVGLGLELKAIADRHPEAKIPENSTFWDEALDVFAKMAQTPGILEDVFRAFGTKNWPKTQKLDQIFTKYIAFKDHLTYDRDDLNGPVWNQTVGGKGGLLTPVDRSLPDSGENRSALQRFMQLLHDANGLGACTKEGAVAHVVIEWPKGSGIKIPFDYPTSSLTPAVCAFVGAPAPPNREKGLRQCGILRFTNVAELLLDVALNRAEFDVRDPCLKKLMDSPLTAIVGGVDAFLEDASGIKGFNTHPTVEGIARFVYFDVEGDTKNAKTAKFLGGVLEPVPSMVCQPAPFVDPSDGLTIPLRRCTSFKDTIRGRDPDSLFPLELDGFIGAVGPLAAAFADHGKPLLFVELFDTMHRHWGSPKQTKEECDPSLPKTDARWCSQDGLVSYEPLLAEMLGSTDLFPTIAALVHYLETLKVPHCDAYDPTTKACTATTERDAISVLADAVRVLLDPERNAGLTDRHGNAFAIRNDGTKNPQVTPLYLLIDALKAIDRAFAEDREASPGETPRLVFWRQARSELVDAWFKVIGAKSDARFANEAIPTVLPLVIDVLRAQIFAHCPDPTKQCTWASKELAQNLADAISGPTAAAAIDLLDAIRRDDAARIEVQKLLVHLIDGASDDDAQTTTLMAAVDLLQVLDDDRNLEPLYRMIASATRQAATDDWGKVVMRGAIDAAVEALARIFAKAHDAKGDEICSREIDPNRTIDFVLKRLFLPYGTAGKDLRTPIETILSVIGDVNRKDPDQTSKLTGEDYRNIAKEIAELCLHPERGLEQVYEVVRLATKPGT